MLGERRDPADQADRNVRLLCFWAITVAVALVGALWAEPGARVSDTASWVGAVLFGIAFAAWARFDRKLVRRQRLGALQLIALVLFWPQGLLIYSLWSRGSMGVLFFLVLVAWGNLAWLAGIAIGSVVR